MADIPVNSVSSCYSISDLVPAGTAYGNGKNLQYFLKMCSKLAVLNSDSNSVTNVEHGFGTMVTICVNFGRHMVFITVNLPKIVKYLCFHEWSSFRTFSRPIW